MSAKWALTPIPAILSAEWVLNTRNPHLVLIFGTSALSTHINITHQSINQSINCVQSIWYATNTSTNTRKSWCWWSLPASDFAGNCSHKKGWCWANPFTLRLRCILSWNTHNVISYKPATMLCIHYFKDGSIPSSHCSGATYKQRCACWSQWWVCKHQTSHNKIQQCKNTKFI
jgi:hypothetical protein